MRTRPSALVAASTAALLLALTGCGSGSSEDRKQAESRALPDFTGKGLQSAQNQAQDAGFHRLTSHDSLGRGRAQALDRNWKVCFQKPAPGTHPTDTVIDFGTVKLEENCPPRDGELTPAPGDGKSATVMPDFAGKSVKVARAALASDTSISVKDATGAERMVIVESNWKICTQDPKAGTRLDGQPVTLRAVKYEEEC
jgi:hypothetical protein